MLSKTMQGMELPVAPLNGYPCYRCERPLLGSELARGMVNGEAVVLCKECAREAGP